MELHIFRLSDNKIQTLSKGLVMQAMAILYECNFIERPWLNNQTNISCIPPGVYTVVNRPGGYNGSRFKYPHFEVLNVPSRTYIKIHIANHVHQIQGCLCPGLNANSDIDGDGQIDVTSSTQALNRLTNLLPSRFKMIVHEYIPV